MAFGDVDVATAVAEIKDQGFYVARSIVPAELCDALVADIRRLYQDPGDVALIRKSKFFGLKTQRFYDLLGLGPAWQTLPAAPALLEVARGHVGKDCLLNSYQTVVIEPGEARQPLHVDDGQFISQFAGLRDRPHRGEGRGRDPIVCNMLVALSDFTERNGATHIVPRTHTLAYLSNDGRTTRDREEPWVARSVRAVMPKGSVLMWDGGVYHCGGANLTSDETRFGLNINYCAGFLRTAENMLLNLGEEKAKAFTAELQILIGYRISPLSGIGADLRGNKARL